MKLSRFQLSILALFALSAIVPVATAKVGAAGPEHAATLDRESFLKEFRQAKAIGAQDQMEKLIQRNQADAVDAIINLCTSLGGATNDSVEDDLNSLRIAWKGSMKTAFVDKVYEYYSLLDGTSRVERVKLVNKYFVYLNKMIKAEADKDTSTIKSLCSDFLMVAESLDAVGDHYYASLAWLSYGRAQDEPQRPDDPNLREAVIGYANSLAARDKIELRDRVRADVEVRHKVLVGMGYGKDGDTGKPGADKPGKGKSGVGMSLGDPVIQDLTFAVEEKPGAIERPFWSNDDVFNAWTSLGFTKVDSRAEFPGIKSIGLVRDTIKSFQVSSGGEKNSMVMAGKMTPCQIVLGDAKLPYAFLTMTGTQKDQYQGVEINMEPSDVQMTVYVAPASKIVGKLAGVPVEIFDDNMNGTYGDAPVSWGHVGMTAEHYMFDFDAIRIDGSKHALPWSRYQKVGDVWYDMAVDGHKLTAAPLDIKTGTLKLKFKGPRPKYVILKGRNNLEDCYFDLAGSKKGIEVPVGNYDLFAGFMSEGKRTAIQKTAILPGVNTPNWRVTEGETVEVELGGPFGFDFQSEDLGANVKILGASVVVTGMNDERYERPWNCRPYSMASIRKSGAKKGGKPEKMKSNLDQSTLYTDWALGFHPQDLELPKKSGMDDGFEVQLTEKKNKLFGKIESDWKIGG
ncbi:MAG: hypothetical protein P8R48_00300 [Planctomycetota bacterium]|nr:hypothetical protein [Planctomycetota bacterium]